MKSKYELPPVEGQLSPTFHAFPYHMAWVTELPGFVGFMEGTVDGEFRTQCMKLPPPYHESVVELFGRYKQVAPHSAYVVRTIDYQSKTLDEVEYMVFRFGKTDK